MGGCHVSAKAPTGEMLDRYRPYLRLLAQARLDPKLRGKVDPSDAVQETMLHAYQALDQYRGQTEQEFAGWLRAILARTLLHLLRDFRRAKRDVRLEKPIQAALDRSSAGLEDWLAVEQSSPSQHVMRIEESLRAAEAVQLLPENQRHALVMYYWQGCSLADVGEHLGRSVSAAAGLVHRGLKRLREQMGAVE